MNKKKAYEILGVSPEDSMEEIKKRYHKLVTKIHPDTEQYRSDNQTKEKNQYSITEVNEAYNFLIKQGEHLKTQVYDASQKQNDTEQVKWDAPLNPGAYAEREIYQYAEDPEGNPIGIYKTANGKYFWNPETEDFSLFLKSIMNTVDTLIEKHEEEMEESFSELRKFEVKKELIYLLAGQYTDIEAGLEAFSKEEKINSEGIHTYYLAAMMELDKSVNWRRMELSPGERLYPLQLKNHRLYLGKKDGKILGYLSFPEDPLYYVLIPMFENREVQVKIEISDERRRNGRGDTFYPLHLWVRKIRKEFSVQESVNVKIDRILEQLG